MFTRLDYYILKQVVTPLIITLSLAALLLLLEKMVRLFDFVVNQGGPVETVFQMLGNLAPHYLGLALPIGLFLGIILAFRKLSLSSELDALLASGISLTRMLRPLLFLSLLLMVLNTALTGWIQPISRYAYSDLVFNLRSGALGASIKVGEFVNLGDNLTMRIESSKNNGAELYGIYLERKKNNRSFALTAKSGGFYTSQDQETMILRVFDGLLIDITEGQSKPRVLSFGQQDILLNLPSPDPFRVRGGAEQEQTLIELWINSTNESLSQESRQAVSGNLHWRLMHSFTFLILPFLAIPMGISNKRTGKSSGVPIGLALLIVYNEIMEGMETAISVSGLSPFITIWLLYSLFAALSLYLFRISAYKVGGDPLLWVDKLWAILKSPLIKLSKTVMRLS